MALLLLILCAGCKSVTSVDPIANELQVYALVFARYDTQLNVPGGTGRSIYEVRADGSGLHDLSSHPQAGYSGGVRGYDTSPQCSPDGRFIAFRTTRDGTEEIYRMNIDGTDQKNLSNYRDFDLEFDWSPDAARIVFTRLVDGQYEIYAMNNDGSSQQNLTNHAAEDRYPSWSPDGSKIAFARLRTLDTTVTWQIMVMNADGTDAVAFTDSTESALYPKWSRDGQRIYYQIPGYGMATKSLDGSFWKRLPNVFSSDMSWAPDGKSFVTSGLTIVDRDLVVIRSLRNDGSQPDWTNDGKWIVFRKSYAAGPSQLYVVRPDGLDERGFTESQYGDAYPSWKHQ